MNENKKIEDRAGIIFPIVILAMAVVTIVTMQETKDWLGIAMNLAFLLFMAVLIMRAEQKGLKKMRLLSEDSKAIHHILKKVNVETDKKTRWDSLKNLNLSFTDEFANDKWKSYVSEHAKAGVDAYLDEEELFSHYEKSYCDMVPGLLTALGILGTFLGLIFSIASFSVENMEQLEQALGNIIGGMNVAFYTSVYGVALSILFNLVSRNCQKHARENLYEMCFYLNTHFEEVSYDDVNKQLVSQNEDHLQEVKDIKNILKYEMAEALSQQLNGNMVPVFEEINHTLKRVIGDFRVEQSAALQHVVESFVDEMAVALDAHINDLGKSVDRLSASQEMMSSEIRNLLNEIETTTKDTKKINFETTDILSKLDSYMGRLNVMMTTASETFNNVNAYAAEMYRATQEQQKFIRDFSACLDESAQETKEVFKNLTDTLEVTNAQYQTLHAVLNKMLLLEQEKLEKADQADEANQSPKGMNEMEYLADKDLKELLIVQAAALKNIDEYLRQQELRRENMWWNRLKKKVETFTKTDEEKRKRV